MAEIVSTDGVLGGKPRLKGHRISVLDVTEFLKAGYSIEETAEHLQITPKEVRAAASYYRTHREQMTELEQRRRERHEELSSEGERPSA